MDPFVLVHGAWQGAWCWKETMEALERRGSRAYAPELSGLGKTVSEPKKVSLADHVEDIVSFIIDHDLSDVTLVGTNYSAALLPMVFDRVPVHIDGIIFIDGLVPRSGESVLDVVELVLPDARQSWERKIEEAGNQSLSPDEGIMEWMLAELPEDRRAQIMSQLQPQPYRTLVDRVEYHSFPSAPPYRSYIRCQKTPLKYTGERMAERADAHLYTLAAGHAAMLSQPELLANRLLEIVNTWNSGDTP